MNIELPNGLDNQVRRLLWEADSDGHPIAGRQLVLKGPLGLLYGTELNAGGDNTTLTLVLKVRDGTTYVAVCD